LLKPLRWDNAFLSEFRGWLPDFRNGSAWSLPLPTWTCHLVCNRFLGGLRRLVRNSRPAQGRLSAAALSELQDPG
jgi:hypothetical protein